MYQRPRIQPTISPRTSGAKVSSISRYSVAAPVVQCWKRWFTPSTASILASTVDSKPAFRAPKLLSYST